MTDSTVSREERRRRRERRQAGFVGLGVLVSSVGATVLLLLVGPAEGGGVAAHRNRAPAPRTAAVPGPAAVRSATGGALRAVPAQHLVAAASRPGAR